MVSLEGFKFRCELVQDTEPASPSWVLSIILGAQKGSPLSQAGASYELTLPRASTHNVVLNLLSLSQDSIVPSSCHGT